MNHAPSGLESGRRRNLDRFDRVGLALCAVDPLAGQIAGRHRHRTGKLQLLFPPDDVHSVEPAADGNHVAGAIFFTMNRAGRSRCPM